MPTKQAQRAEINTFVKGLITEASPLNFPPDASADEENFDLHRDGSRSRRLGMDFEEVFQMRDTGLDLLEVDNAGINSYKWKDVAGTVTLELQVVQFNQRIVFFDTSKSSISTEGFIGELILSEFPINKPYFFASIEGYLIVVAGVDSFAIISYNQDAGTLTLEYDRIKIRDVFGVEEPNQNYENDVSFRGLQDPYHYYNLQNQSWGISRLARYPIPGSSRIAFVDPIQAYRQIYFPLVPSNSEQVWTGMQFTPVTGGADPYERMFTNLFSETIGSKLVSAKGYFIIDALRRGQSRVEAQIANADKYQELFKWPVDGSVVMSIVPARADFTPGGASCVTEYAGRIFYSGFEGRVIDGDARSPNYSNYVFFSQLVKNKRDLAKCYQEGDPTSREENDLVDTDGGFLRISEAIGITSMVNIGSQLIVLATNGIWSITGGSDYGFAATNYKVTKISTIGCVSNTSIVVEGEQVFYWAFDGIYTINRNQFGDLVVSSLTVNTIQKFYDEISTLSRERAFGLYDTLDKKIRWLYREGPLFGTGCIIKELIFDTQLGCFYPYRIMTPTINGTTVVGMFITEPLRTGFEEDNVFVDAEQVVMAGDAVIIDGQFVDSVRSNIKYITLRNQSEDVIYTFSQYKDRTFRDWKAIDGVGIDAEAFFLTGDQTVGDSAVMKQVPYLIAHMFRTERTVDSNGVPQNPSGCIVRVRWSFTDGSQSGKWTVPFQIYRYPRMFYGDVGAGTYETGHSLITSKSKVRGRGQAFAIHFKTEPDKDCQLIGWNLTINGNSNV